MNRTSAPLAVAVAVLLAAAPLSAARAQYAPPPVMDQVTFTLSAEDWVKTQTAEVTLLIDAAATKAESGDAGSARSDVMAAAQALSDKAEWKVVRFDRQQDQAGLDRWQAALQARLPEGQVGGLADKARKASRPGLQIRVEQVAFTPSLAETEAVRSRLRAELYRRVTEELASVQKGFPDRRFRVAGVDFMEEALPPMPKMGRTMAMAAEAAPGGAGLDVADRLRLVARVTLSAVAPLQNGP